MVKARLTIRAKASSSTGTAEGAAGGATRGLIATAKQTMKEKPFLLEKEVVKEEKAVKALETRGEPTSSLEQVEKVEKPIHKKGNKPLVL